jgi:Zn finger protein HypA/HybF involved in hydrogenase expression
MVWNKSNSIEFINKAKKIHGNTYCYKNVLYTDARTKVNILCSKHGYFSQKPYVHLSGSGCPKCGNENVGKKLTKRNVDFIDRANIVHNNRYDYSLSEYTGAKNKIKIKCRIHGVFIQSPTTHLNGSGCPHCSTENNNLFSIKGWIKSAKNSNKFDSFKVYVIKCHNENEEFYKIGRTFVKIEERFSHKKRMPYDYEIISVIKSTDASYIHKLENKLKSINKLNSYEPLLNFGGLTECFKKVEWIR